MQKVDTGKIYAMKLLKKDDMLKKDQARWPFFRPVFSHYAEMLTKDTASSCPCGTRCDG